MNKKYLLLGVIYIFTILLVFYCSKIYSNSMMNVDSDAYNNVTSSNYDILFNNISNFSKEHHDFVVCVSTSSLGMESDSILFVDASVLKIRDLNRLVSDFGYSYSFDDSFPVFIVFKDDKIIDITYDSAVLEVID